MNIKNTLRLTKTLKNANLVNRLANINTYSLT